LLNELKKLKIYSNRPDGKCRYYQLN